MITLRSSQYTLEDYAWLLQQLDSVAFDCSEICTDCEHKNACGDLVRFRVFIEKKHNEKQIMNNL